MNGHVPQGGIPLGAAKPVMAEIIIYPVAQVEVKEGGQGLGDATHHLSIVLPVNGREIRIPFNQRGLRNLGADMQRAAERGQMTADEKESN